MASDLVLVWDPNPESDIEDYELSYGTQPGVYTESIYSGVETTATVDGLEPGETYYFAVVAINTTGLRSVPSDEVSWQVPETPPESVADIPQAGWVLHTVDSEEDPGFEAGRAFDGDPATFWHSAFTSGETPLPHDLQIDLGSVFPVAGFRYLPRQDAFDVGDLSDYEFYLSLDGTSWGSPVATGSFAAGKNEKSVFFTSENARYIRLRATGDHSGSGHSNVAELNVLRSTVGTPPPVNQAPVASGGSVTTGEDKPVSITLSANDPDNDTLTYAVVSGPSHGTLSGTAPNLSYTPGSGFGGSDSFTFRTNDGELDSNIATVAITVTAASGPDPIARTGWSLHHVDSEDGTAHPATNAIDGDPDTFWHTRWDSTATPPPHEIQIDLGSFYQIDGFHYLPRQDSSLIGNIGQYELYLSADGSSWGAPVASGTFTNDQTKKEITFSPAAGRYLRLRALTEASGAMHSSAAELNVLGTPLANRAPTATPLTMGIAAGGQLPITLRGSDPDLDPLDFTIVSGPSHGSISGTPPAVTYTPAAGFNGSDSFTFRVGDSALSSPPATVSITVAPPVGIPVNRPPSFDSDPVTAPGACEQIAYKGGSLAGQASDPDPDDTLTFSKTSGPGWLRVAADGGLSGTPPNRSAGLHEFTVRVTDAAGAFDKASLQIQVEPHNLPLPWDLRELGVQKAATLAGYQSGSYTLRGGGTLGRSKDRGTFIWQTLSGDGQIIARVRSIRGADRNARAGVMIRDSLATNSRNVFLSVDRKGAFRWLRRNQGNGRTVEHVAAKGVLPKTWLRLVRKGDTITSYRSANGKNWKRVGRSNLRFAKHCYIGLMVGGDEDGISSAEFRQVRVNP